MAHNLNFDSEGNAAFFSVKEKAWHNLGTIVEDYPTSAEALKLAKLDFTVEKEAIQTEFGSPINTHFATVRTDTNQILGVVGNRYEVVQNIDAFDFFDSIVGNSTGIKYETAGALGRGEKIFITAKLPDYIKVASDDLIEQYLFLTTSHDGSSPITAAFTPVRIVCNNTLNAALRNMSNQINIRHTSGAKEQLAQAHQLMGICGKLAVNLEDHFQEMTSARITDGQLLRLIELSMAPNDVIFEAVKQRRTDIEFSKQFQIVVSDIYEYCMESPAQNMASTQGTAFGAYNAVTGYFQNVKDWKSSEEQVKSIIYGNARNYAQRAFNICMNSADYLN